MLSIRDYSSDDELFYIPFAGALAAKLPGIRPLSWPKSSHLSRFRGVYPIHAHSLGRLRRGSGLQRAITLNTSASFRTLPLNLTDMRRMSFFESQIRGTSGKVRDFATYQLISSLHA